MNKKHWNTVYVEIGELDGEFVRKMIDHSYELVVGSLTEKVKRLNGLAG